MFIVKSRQPDAHNRLLNRENGAVGPFEKRDTAERALIALCQAGQATAGEIVEVTSPERKNPLLEAAEHGKALAEHGG